MNLNENLWAVVKEYTRQTAALLDVDLRDVSWIGANKGVVGVCDFGGVTFLTLEEMQIIIDRLPEWRKRYAPGKITADQDEEVARQVREWAEWSATPDNLVDGHPTINLEHWLMGCPRKLTDVQRHYKDIIWDKNCIAVVESLMSRYRGNRSLANVYDSLNKELQEKQKIFCDE